MPGAGKVRNMDMSPLSKFDDTCLRGLLSRSRRHIKRQAALPFKWINGPGTPRSAVSVEQQLWCNIDPSHIVSMYNIDTGATVLRDLFRSAYALSLVLPQASCKNSHISKSPMKCSRSSALQFIIPTPYGGVQYTLQSKHLS